MRCSVLVLLVLLVLLNLETLCQAQCNPRIISFPPVQIRGDLLCEDTSLPIDPTAIELIVDGVLCPHEDWDFYYPFLHDGFYKIEFWMDNTIAHEITICVEGTCGGNLVTAGFSDDGVTSFPCSNVITFPQYEMMIINPVILPSALTPQISGLTGILVMVLFTMIMVLMRIPIHS
jgi:hypothetical protein